MNRCGVIEDLLPLYLDGICTEESRNIVETHLKDCKDCKKLYESMRAELQLPENHDDKVMKAVKRRILIEKIVIVCVSVWIICSVIFFTFLHCAATYTRMREVDADKEINITELENGDLVLARNGKALDTKAVMLSRYNTAGEVIVDAEKKIFNQNADDAHVVVEVVLCESILDQWTHKILGETGIVSEEQSVLFNKNENVNYEKVIIKTGKDDTEYVLWER